MTVIVVWNNGMGMGLEPDCPVVSVILEDQEENESDSKEKHAHNSWRYW